MEALQQYSYLYNIKIFGFSQAKESESCEDTAKLCLELFSYLGVDGTTLHDIDIAHRVQGRASAVGNKLKSIICKFIRRLAKEKVMAARRASWDISSQELGLPENITFERIGIYSRSYKSFFIAPTTSKLNMATNYVGQKMQLSSFPKNEILRPIKLR